MRIRVWAVAFLMAFTGLVQADEKSGPGRTTISTFQGGTVYYVDKMVSATATKRAQWTMQTKKGPIVVTKTPWGFLIKGAEIDVKLESQMGGLKVEDAKRTVTVESEFGGTVVVDYENDKLTFKEEGLNGIVVTGTRGTLKVEKDLPNIKVSSRAGTSTFLKRFDEYKRDGLPIFRHPNTTRALLFERGGVGFMIDLLPYHHSAMKGILDWSRVKKI